MVYCGSPGVAVRLMTSEMASNEDVLSDAAVRTVFHSVPDAILVCETETGAIIDVNQSMCEMYGYSREQARQLAVGDLRLGHHTDGLEEADSPRQQPDKAGSKLEECRTEASDCERFWVEASLSRAQIDGEPHTLVILRDISERKAQHQQDVTERLTRTHRLRDQRDNLGLLNSVVRHDIRNDLQLVDAYSEMLEDHVDEQGEAYLSLVRKGTTNALDLTEMARELADVMLHPDRQCNSVSVHSILDRQINAVGSAYPDAEISTAEPLVEATVVADELLDAVFRNLLKNAVQHNDSETPVVTVSGALEDDPVEIRIADNGPGVTAERKDAIFGNGEQGLESDGTGIGLFLVQSLVESYGGTVWVEDNTPSGAVFVVSLPLAE